VLTLDAASKNSYPGSGTVWTDLSGNNNSGSLVNGPTFSSANAGSIVFNGSNDYVALGNPSVSTQITVETFIKVDTSNITGAIVASYILGRENSFRLLAYTSSFSWVCATTNNSWYSTGTFLEYSASVNNAWNHVVGTYDGAKNNLYINGSLAITGSSISGNLATAIDNFKLMNTNAAAAPNVAYTKGYTGTFRVYNRALSAAEVLQNYNATKSRFNL
jgi:hypothetical protein